MRQDVELLDTKLVDKTPALAGYDVGLYAKIEGSAESWTRTNIACPYCHEPLQVAQHPERRIIERVGTYRNDPTVLRVAVERVPDDLAVVACGDCFQTFTMPRELLS